MLEVVFGFTLLTIPTWEGCFRGQELLHYEDCAITLSTADAGYRRRLLSHQRPCATMIGFD